MLEKVRQKQPVLWSELRRSYPNSEAAPLVAVRDRLIADGRLRFVGYRLELGTASHSVPPGQEASQDGNTGDAVPPEMEAAPLSRG